MIRGIYETIGDELCSKIINHSLKQTLRLIITNENLLQKEARDHLKYWMKEKGMR